MSIAIPIHLHFNVYTYIYININILYLLYFICYKFYLHAGENSEVCYHDGQSVSFNCVVSNVEHGSLIWNGIGFNCSNPMIRDDILPLLITSLSFTPQYGMCGPYNGTLKHLGNRSFVSDLVFTASYSMNEGEIKCIQWTTVLERILLHIGGNNLLCIQKCKS